MISGRSSPGSGRGERDDGVARHVPGPWHPVVRHRLALPASLPQDPCASEGNDLVHGARRKLHHSDGPLVHLTGVRDLAPSHALVHCRRGASPLRRRARARGQGSVRLSPVALGVGTRREICVPVRAFHELDEGELRALLGHEVAHHLRVVRDGVELIAWYDSSRDVFTGTVTNTNTTNATVRQVRVEIHLSNGTELGPTPRVDLPAGERHAVELDASGQSFDWWSVHIEIGSDSG